MTKICTKPFNNIEISWDGNIFTCCPMYVKYQRISNLFDDDIKSIEDIWHSETACKLREKILSNDYSMCDLDICRERVLEENTKNYTQKPPMPEFVTLSYDKECNIRCITCRDKIIKNNKEKIDAYNNKILTTILPLLNNAKVISINGLGEAFYSKHSRQLLKKLTEYNKTTKFRIYTNGILFNQKNCKQLGLENRIENVCFSIQALNEKLYKQIMVGSNLKVVLNNLKWAATQQELGIIDSVTINTVISKLNFREIPQIIKLAKELNIFVSFSAYSPWGTSLDKQYEELAIWQPTNPLFDEFIKVLKEAKEINYNKFNMPQIFPIV